MRHSNAKITRGTGPVPGRFLILDVPVSLPVDVSWKDVLWWFTVKSILAFGTLWAVLALASLPAFAQEAPASAPDYSSAKEYLTTYIRNEMGSQNIKGLSLALVDGSQVVWREGFGMADEARKIPATADTLYRIQSVSKLFTAVEIMKLAEKGWIDLDRPLTDYIPGFSIHSRFQAAKEITLRSLLAHHSGMPADYMQGMWVDHADSLAQLVRNLKPDYLVAPPQTFYKYSNLDYSLLGRVIELQTHKAFPTALREDLLDPLGMESSTFDPAPNAQERLAKGYSGGRETPPLYLRDVPAVGMVSSADDMARFIQFLFAGSGSPIKPGTISAMFKEQYKGLSLDFGHRMGLGWMLSGLDIPGSQGTAWHDGDYPPYFCHIAVLTRQKLGVVVLSNTAEARPLGEEVVSRALKLMLQAKYGLRADLAKPKILMPPLVEVPEEKIDRYTGYYSGIGKPARISQGGAHLLADLLGHQFDLVPTANNKFIPRIMILFFPIHIPQYAVEFTQVKGKDVAILTGLREPVVFEKIVPVAIPPAWRQCLGKYRLDDPDGETEFKNMTMEEHDGLITVNSRITSKVFIVKDEDYKITLEPISKDDAVVSGLFYPDGDTVHVDRQGDHIRLYYAGLRFTKTDAPGCCLVSK